MEKSSKKHRPHPPIPVFVVTDTAGTQYDIKSATRARKRGEYRLYVKAKAAPPPPPPPAPPPGIEPCSIPDAPPGRKDDVLTGVNDPSRLQVLNDCTYVKGSVTSAPQKEADGDWHIYVKPDSDSPVQAQGNIPSGQAEPVVVAEIIPLDQPGGQSGLNLTPPNAGDHVVLYGPNCFDTNHGWGEIHPVFKVSKLS